MRKGHFLMKKGTKNYPPSPYSISFLSALHQNKALYNFRKRGQHSIVKCSVGPEYALYIVNDTACQQQEALKKIFYHLSVLQIKSTSHGFTLKMTHAYTMYGIMVENSFMY